ncbi:MAG: DinB family protein [Calditrichaeota bacterium]|nr:DinB family protein [Calditrichota bacterium]RQW01130.1 MAG: DinB family protein [Calditrichota bacterium]
MDKFWKNTIWQQFGAAIDMLENAINACPEYLWKDTSQQPEFWYISFHTLFFLDYYLTPSQDQFTPPSPFTMDELDPSGKMPERSYAKFELMTYLRHGREKCHKVISEIKEEEARCYRGPDWLGLTLAELLLYNMRHVQHHAAQLNLILRQRTASAPGWIRKSR